MNAHYRDPEAPWNPRTPVDITPEAFERIVLDWLTDSAGQAGLEINAKHLGVVNGSGGDYKIDVLVTFTVFGGAEIVVLVECKHHRRPVERDDALILEAKLRDVGAHKGMLFSTSGFQEGALKYASGQGIATVTVSSRESGFMRRKRRLGGQWSRRAGGFPLSPVSTNHSPSSTGATSPRRLLREFSERFDRRLASRRQTIDVSVIPVLCVYYKRRHTDQTGDDGHDRNVDYDHQERPGDDSGKNKAFPGPCSWRQGRLCRGG